MKIIDIKDMPSFPYDERDRNIFYQKDEFKARIIELSPGGEMPLCEMVSYVMFYVIKGETEVTVNREKVKIREGQCLVTEPATLSMKTEKGVKIMGIQINKR